MFLSLSPLGIQSDTMDGWMCNKLLSVTQAVKQACYLKTILHYVDCFTANEDMIRMIVPMWCSLNIRTVPIQSYATVQHPFFISLNAVNSAL